MDYETLCLLGPRASKGETPLDTELLARRAADAALERKAQNVVVIDVRGRSSYADFLVIASGTSDRQVQSIAQLVRETLGREDVRPVGSEGTREGQWALVDFGAVVVHVFHEYTREVYDLEGMWKKAPRLRVQDVNERAARL